MNKEMPFRIEIEKLILEGKLIVNLNEEEKEKRETKPKEANTTEGYPLTPKQRAYIYSLIGKAIYELKGYAKMDDIQKAEVKRKVRDMIKEIYGKESLTEDGIIFPSRKEFDEFLQMAKSLSNKQDLEEMKNILLKARENLDEETEVEENEPETEEE